MRNDSLGFFWQDLQEKAKRGTYIPVLAAIPETGWKAPQELPRLSGEAVLGLDIETKDIDLREKGPGFRRDAHIVGISVATVDGKSWYLPMRHEVCHEQNLDPDHVLAWARDNLCTVGQTKVGANLAYDVDGLWAAGVPVTGPFVDVQYAAALLDENRRSYSLESLLQSEFGEGKVKGDLENWVQRSYGAGDDYRADIWRSPPCLVGPYAEGDTVLPLRLWQQQRTQLEKVGLTDLFNLETELLPAIVKMRQRGVRVDLDYARRLDDELTQAIADADEKMSAFAGHKVDPNIRADLVRLFDNAGVWYPRTKEGTPSFAKDFLEHCPFDGAKLIIERRKLEKYRNTFVRGYVLDLNVNGRLHAVFHPLRTDDNGTVSGRYSSSMPNLQNIPVRDEYWGPRLRAMFCPEEGEQWGRHDWSQIEYRFLTHYGRGESAKVAREQYRRDPRTDFHEMTLRMVAPAAGWDISTPEKHKARRRPIKNINFGLTYGMGKDKLTRDLGLTQEQGDELFNHYHRAVPFVKKTYNAAQEAARHRGYIRTVLGRYARFDLFEPYGNLGDKKALPYDEAVQRYGSRVVRAFTHKALNRLLQGSAADLMKLAMRDLWRSGVHDVLGQMLITCHDETGHSVPQTLAGREAMNEVKHIMETCMQLRVPVLAEQNYGANWGDCK